MAFQHSVETVSCLICKSQDAEERFQKDGLRVVRCKQCHLTYVNPRLKPETLSQLYNSDAISPHSYYQETRHADHKTFTKRLDFLQKISGDKKKLRILDIGCNIGTLLFAAKQRGWECHGIDINAKVKPFFKDSGVHLKIGDVLKASYKKNSFDLIVMNDLIEHIPDPRALLRKVHELLKQHGLLFLVTPDDGSFIAKIMGKHWFHFKPREHLYYFSKQHLRRLLRETGFTPYSFKHLGRYRSLNTLAEKSASFLGPFSRFGLKVFKFLHMDTIVVPFNMFDEYAVVAKK